MNIIAFVESVRKMRQAQKNYFHGRAKVDLIEAKQIEKLVDEAFDGTITFDPPIFNGARKNLEDVLFLIREERGRQDAKWGADRMMKDQLWLAVLLEEVGEAAKAILEGLPTLEKEVMQSAAVAVAWIENIRRREVPVSEEAIWKLRYFEHLMHRGVPPNLAAECTAGAEVLLDIPPEESADDEISEMN